MNRKNKKFPRTRTSRGYIKKFPRAGTSRGHIMYGSTKVGSRGQVVLPIGLRKKLKIEEGEILFVCEDGDCVKIMKSDILRKVMNKV